MTFNSIEESVLVDRLNKGERYASAREFWAREIEGRDFWVFSKSATEAEKADFFAMRAKMLSDELDRLQEIYFTKEAA